MRALLDLVLSQGLACAPHVATRVFAEVGGDEVAFREVAARLEESQRRGLRPLPSPLPMVDAIAERYADLVVSGRDRSLLNAVALTLDDRLIPVLAFDGREAIEIMESAVADLLHVRAGRIRLDDPRLAIWLMATSTHSELVEVHDGLHRIFSDRRETLSAQWHRARASLVGVPEAAAELIRIARQHSEGGLSERALRLAAEAAEHATGAERDESALLAGVACIASGYFEEAVSWLARLFPSGEEPYRLHGLGGMLFAQAHLQGTVPDVDPAMLRPRSGGGEEWHAWARSTAFAAAACAERGDRRRMRAWLAALDDASARFDSGRDLRDPVVALAWLVSGEREVESVDASGPLSGSMLQALRAAIGGDVDRGLRVLAVEETGIATAHDPFAAGFENSPLIAAYRAVAQSLLLLWRGDIGAAHDLILDAAGELPIAIPFAGLGVVLARRLDLLVLGHLGPVALSLTATLPVAARLDRLVDQAIGACLRGAVDDAQACLRLWSERGAVQPLLTVPGVEEMLPITDRAHSLRRRAEPPDATGARALRMRIARATESEWVTVSGSVTQAARSIESPFERARIELMIAERWAGGGDRALSRRHLRSAQRLFQEVGAVAAAAACVAHRQSLDEDDDDPAGAQHDPVGQIRRRWEGALTPRELEVALMVIRGTSNRDIGSALHVSVRTVEVHLSRVFGKLGVRSRVELTVLAHRPGA